MVDSQPIEGEIRGAKARDVGMETHWGPTEPVLQKQKTPSPSPAFIKENIDVLRTMIKEHDQQDKTKATPRRLTYADSYKETPARTEKVKRGKRYGHQETSSDSKYEEGSKDTYEDLNSPYKRPKPTPFTQKITRFKYDRKAKLPRNIRVYEGNKYPEDHLSIFSAAAKQEEWLMPAWCKMFRQTLGGARYVKDPTEIHDIKKRQHEELAKKLNDKIPKMVDKMFKRVRAFIRGEVATGSAKMVRPSQWDKGNVRPAWFGGPKKTQNRGALRESRRNMGIYTPYPIKVTFTPLIKTPKEILAMENKRSCGLKEVGPSGKGCPPKQPEERESRKEKRLKIIKSEGFLSTAEVRQRSCFSGETYHPLGVIDLRVNMGEAGRNKTVLMDFVVVKCRSPYNIIIGRTGMRSLRAVGSTIHSMIKFPTNQGIVTMVISKEAMWECIQLKRVQGSWKEVANTIPVKLANGTWKVQVDYSSLNKVCAKDMYPFLEEREELASLMEYPYKCFLRLPKENSQIRMAENDEEKTGFHTEEGVYCFTHMPKGLKNSATTLQRMMEKVLADQKGRNVEVYLEEIVVKSKSGQSLVQDIQETLRKLKRVNIKIDLNASSFGVEEGKLYLGKEAIEEGSGVGITLVSPDEKMHSYAIRLKFNASDHAMDCEALLAELFASVSKGMKDLHVFIDSLTLVAQIEGNHTPITKQERKYNEDIMDVTAPFHRFRITHLPKILNSKTEVITGLATIKLEFLNQEVSVGIKTRPSVEVERATPKVPVKKSNYNWETSGSN
ncbi:reverse transcriptase domain-containing protein [Tanacetum coccineum]